MGFDVDGTTLLKDQQASFIRKLNDGLENLSIYERPGVYAERKTISGEELKQIRSHCWNMVEKFKNSCDVIVLPIALLLSLSHLLVNGAIAFFLSDIVRSDRSLQSPYSVAFLMALFGKIF